MNKREQADKLFHGNMGLAYSAANKYGRMIVCYPEYDWDDALQLCLMGLWTAACKFDGERSVRFSTFAHTCMFRQVLSARRKAMRQSPAQTVSIEELGRERDEAAGTAGWEWLAAPGDLEEDVCNRILLEELRGATPEKKRRMLEAER